MADSHDPAVLGPCDAFEAIRERFDDERVVTDGVKTIRNVFKQAFAVMKDAGGAAVNRLGSLNAPSPERQTDSLMAEADTKNGLIEFFDDAPADAEITRIFGSARSRRDDDVVEIEAIQLFPGKFIVADQNRLRAGD